jgi:hypothetical protein
MRFIQLFESPDTIITANGIWVSYTDPNKESYTVLTLPAWDYCVVMRKDDGALSGHGKLIRLLSDMSKGLDMNYGEILSQPLSMEEVASRIKAGVSPTTGYQSNDHLEGVIKTRIWVSQKIFSFWREWNKSFVAPSIAALKLIGENPEEYTFEMGGSTKHGDGKHQPSILNYNEFLSGEKDSEATDEERQAEIKRMQDMDMFRKLQDNPEAAMQQIKLNKEYGFDPITGKKKEANSFYSRMGD